MALPPTRICLLTYEDGGDVSTLVVGWHRVDGPDYQMGRDDGNDHHRLSLAVAEAGLPDGIAYTISYRDLDLS